VAVVALVAAAVQGQGVEGVAYLDQVLSEGAADAAIAQLYQLLLHRCYLLCCCCTTYQVSINVQLCHVIHNDRHLMKHACNLDWYANNCKSSVL